MASHVSFAQAPPLDVAAVEIDGNSLFRVRGVEARPADERAAAIEAAIEELAADKNFGIDGLQTRDSGPLVQIVANQRVIMNVSDPDAELQGTDRSLAAALYVERIRKAIGDYRHARQADNIAASAVRTAAVILVALLFLGALLWATGKAEAGIERAFDRRTSALGVESRRLLKSGKVVSTARGAFGFFRIAVALIVILLVVHYSLNQFPWTREAGKRLFGSLTRALQMLGEGFIDAIPKIVVLVIIFLIARRLLWLARLYFDAVGQGRLSIHGFDQHWAGPTYLLVRLGVILVAVLVAYRFIPGSDTYEFKGLSILAGILFSLGASSALTNVFAGYVLLYRRTFRVGDVVQIGGLVGTAIDVRLQVTRLRTFWNEEVTIPNSRLLTESVLNFSQPGREGRLILHANVSIGYGTPWRSVEQMLLAAARKTQGLVSEPPPFVVLRELGEFAVAYQVNAYTDRADGFRLVTADLQRNILDVFNEHEVQIMTPAYEADPPAPKIAPSERRLHAEEAEREG